MNQQPLIYHTSSQRYALITAVFLLATVLLTKALFIFPFKIHSTPLVFFTLLTALVTAMLIISWIISVRTAVYDGATLTITHTGGYTTACPRAQIARCSYKYIKDKTTWATLQPYVIWGERLTQAARPESGTVFLRIHLVAGRTKVFTLKDTAGADFARKLSGEFI